MEVEKLILIIGTVATLITACGVIIGTMTKLFDRAMAPIDKKIEKMDELQCKALLVDFLNDVENGIEKDEVQYKLAHETFDHYTKDLHKNSYIHDRWNCVMK